VTRPADRPVLPGATLGVLGGGQLGRMFAMAARRLGYRVHTLTPDDDSPTGQLADLEVHAAYDDVDAVRAFARGVDVVTFEFENVLAAAARTAEEHALVRPGSRALEVAQHRVREKAFLEACGLPVTPFAPVTTEPELEAACHRIGRPAVLKTATFGYDGKGQVVISPGADPGAAWEALGRREAILEAFVDLERELSMVGARGVDGRAEYFGPIENIHTRQILDTSVAPAGVPPPVMAEARRVTEGVLEALDYVGVLCVEFFLARDGRLLINEVAPRPHNSGHLTIDACRTSQFEQQVRAICGVPLGSMEMLQPAAMANLLGDLWIDGEPDWVRALALPDVKLHLYGKSVPRPGRKMGHVTALAATGPDARARVVQARNLLRSGTCGASP
jgi:5-(carboxyamino)imidazole ribonucleotide synthase